MAKALSQLQHSPLESLDLASNKITIIPFELFDGTAEQLRLDLSGNSSKCPPQQIGEKWTTVSDIKRFYKPARERPDSVRLLLVGYGGVGKTKLLAALQRSTKPSDIPRFWEKMYPLKG